MSNKKKEDFFQILNLVATKKVKVRYCRTIKERLRPSTIEESLALPSKPKSPPKRKVEEALFSTPEAQAASLLRGGVSLLKSYKNKKKIKMKSSSPSAAPCTKSLLSYLQHKAKDSDSSSVESDNESAIEFEENQKEDFKLKEISVSMARLSPQKLERISSRTGSLDSGGDDLKMKGFSDDSVMTIKQNKKNLGDLIDNLETEIDEKHDLVTPVDKSHDSFEIVEDKDLVMRMVEDFSLLSESESDEELDNTTGVIVKSEPSEPMEQEIVNHNIMVWIPDENSSFKKEVYKDQKVEEHGSAVEENGRSEEEVLRPKDAGSALIDSNEETLEEMLQRLENSSSANKERKSKKVAFLLEDRESSYDETEISPNDLDRSSLVEFENEALANLVSRIRRESRIDKIKKNRVLMDGSQKSTILEKRNYWIKKEDGSSRKPYNSIILSEPKQGFTRLSKPGRDDVLKARKVLGIYDATVKGEGLGLDITEDGDSQDEEVIDKLDTNKLVELNKKKKVKKKRLLEKKRKKRVNGIDDYIKNMLENRDKLVSPSTETSVPFPDSSTNSVVNVICNHVDVSSEINSTSISRDTLDTSLHDDMMPEKPTVNDDVLFQNSEAPSTVSNNTQHLDASGKSPSGGNMETNPWGEVCILEKVESPKKKIADIGMEDLSINTLGDDELDLKDEEAEIGLGLKKYQCNKCGKEFGTKNGLDYHERTHSGISPFECDVCFKRFKSSSLCSRHKQIHSITKKYNCDVCLKSFAQKSNLSKHMDIHAGIKPYQCPTCPKAFTQKVHLECHIMTHTKDKPWKCLSCETRFSKKSSLIRHSQNVHYMGKDDHEKFILLDESKFEQSVENMESDDNEQPTMVKQMKKEKKIRREKFETVSEPPGIELQQLNVIPIAVEGDQVVTNTVLDNLVQNDLNEVNEQFDVEVTYCEDIDILNVPNDTLFIMDSSFEEKSPKGKSSETKVVAVSPISKVKSNDTEQESEQIEDIEKFLKESKSSAHVMKSGDNLDDAKLCSDDFKGNTAKVVSLDVPEPTGDKKPKYRIPKSPRKNLGISKLDNKTPHIPYKKESGLKIISVSDTFSRNKVKNDIRSPKKHSFEQALNEASTVPSKRVDRFLERKLVTNSKSIQKSSKPVIRKINVNDKALKGTQDVVLSQEKNNASPIVLSKPNTTFQSPKTDVIKRIIDQQTSSNVISLDKKPVIKPLFKPVKPNGLDPKRITLENSVPKHDASFKKFEPPPSFSTSQLKSLSESLSSLPTIAPAASAPRVADMKHPQPVASSQDLYNSLKADLFNNSSGLDLYSSSSVRSLPVPVPASSELQSTLTTISAYLNTTTLHPTQAVVEPIKRSESQGYYTSNRATTTAGKINPELTDIESTDVESEEDNAGHPKGHLTTFLPTNFPTFDSPSSSPRSLSGLSSASGINYGSSLSSFNHSYSPQPGMVGNIKHSAIKPTAVVSPSRPRMPILPKPVPAAIASPVRVEKVSVVTNFMCSVCGAEFNSRENLVTHEQSTHWRL